MKALCTVIQKFYWIMKKQKKDSWLSGALPTRTDLTQQIPQIQRFVQKLVVYTVYIVKIHLMHICRYICVNGPAPASVRMCLTPESLTFHLATQWTGTKYRQTINPLFVPNHPGGLSCINTCVGMCASVCGSVRDHVTHSQNIYTTIRDVRLQATQQLNSVNK